MKMYKLLSLIFLVTSALSCGGDTEEKIDSEFSLKLFEDKTEYQLGQTLNASIVPSTSTKDSVVFYLGTVRLGKSLDAAPFQYRFEENKLGKWTLTARLYEKEHYSEVSRDIILYNHTPPTTYTYTVINTYPHATDAYTQGLEFDGDRLYESTGHYGESSLREVNLESGEVLRKLELPEEYFAEGITILGGKLYMLTWKEGMGFIYDLKSFEKIGEFAYGESKEGWGLTNDMENLYKSDGSEKIWILDPETLEERSFIQTVTHRTIATQLNELEWVNGKIYANTYQKDGVAIINPENGAVEGIIDFSGLREQLGNVNDLDPVNDVLNGIAYHSETGKLYVTGKDWDTLFEVEIEPK